MMRIVTKPIFFWTVLGISLPVASTAFDIVANIFGGNTAEEGDFPYFVQLNGCGASLIAPDIVLTAAHCGDRTGQEIYISAYKTLSTEYGAQVRVCDTYIMHPYYIEGPGLYGLTNDVALCKLNQVVTIDESEIRLELNRDNIDEFPIVGEELVAMGFGLLNGNEETPTFLQRTTLEGRQCDQSQSSIEHVCAGGANGQDGVTDVCRGDSGGPLVNVVPQSGGPDIHYHVGLVSTGAWCPEALTGVYARTSEMVSWIDEGMCLLNSVSAVNCEDDNEVVECDANQSELVVTVLTDKYSYENQWYLEKLNSDQVWVEVERELLQLPRHLNQGTVCLEPDSKYRWTLTDSYGDGLCGVECGSFSVTLNGVEIVADGPFEFEVSKELTTAPTTPDSIQPTIQPTNRPTKVSKSTKKKSSKRSKKKAKRARRL